MTRAATAESAAEDDTAGVNPDHESIWGADIVSLHDLFWASRCIQVVRPGREGSVQKHGPALYLLLGVEQLVHFPLDKALKRLHWASPRLLRMRVVTHDPIDYTEHVEQDDSGVRFRRSYRRPVERSERAWLTGEAQIAKQWAAAGDNNEARRRIRRMVPRDAMESIAFAGESYAAEKDRARWLSGALSQWKTPNAVIPELYEYQAGVWAHETAEITPGARIIGPAWIGAGARVAGDEVVVGPVIMPDAGQGPASGVAVGPSRHIDWDLVRSPHWSLPSLATGGTWRRVTKRAFDIAFSLAVIVGALPLCIPVMMAIYLEDGRPIFFAHRRQTLGGREFPCLKFRTMRRDAEKMKQDLVTANAADGPQFFIKNDPRVTRIGRFLRKTQLDELPQFLNVLMGHMSVVGPRPSPDNENQFCPAWREARLSVRPGITGLWQVSRTREPQTDFQEWIRYDLEYVQHQSFIGDLRIIAETIRDMFHI